MRSVVDSFARLEGRLPNTLEEACFRVMGDWGARSKPHHCGYWLHDGDTIPLDGWRNAIRYVAGDGEVAMRSAGPDGQFGNADDMVFSMADERRRIRAAAGCFLVDFRDWKEFPGDILTLDTTPLTSSGYYAAFPIISPYFTPSWELSPYATGRDSIYVIWQAHHHGVHFHFLVYTDSMTGFVFGGPYRRSGIVARRTECPSGAA